MTGFEPEPQEPARIPSSTITWHTYHVSEDDVIRALRIPVPPGAETELRIEPDGTGFEIVVKGITRP